MCKCVCVRVSGNHACRAGFLWWHRKWWCNSIQSPCFFHTLPVSGSAFLTLAYLPLVLESCEHGGYGHGLWALWLRQMHTHRNTELRGWELGNPCKCSSVFISHSRPLTPGRFCFYERVLFYQRPHAICVSVCIENSLIIDTSSSKAIYSILAITSAL